MRPLILFILLLLPTITYGQYPDGTVVFSSKPNTVIGNVAQRWANRAQGYRGQYTHVGIILNGKIYHADYPRVETRTTLKPGERAVYMLPKNFSSQEKSDMLRYANSQLGRSYRLRGFIRNDGTEGWCSPFVKNVLNQAGYNLTYQDGFTPDNLLKAITK